MTNSQKHALRLSEVRERLNVISGLEGDAYSEEVKAEEARLQTEYRETEQRYRSAIIAEDAEQRQAATEFGTAEERELAEIRGRVSIANYVDAAREMRSASGAELEFNQALSMGAEMFPLELLAPPLEQRSTTDEDAGATQQSWVDRLFADTAAMRLGITMPSVAPGVASYPVTTGGASAAQRGRTEAAADGAWTVGVTEIKPTRNSVRVVFSMEDAARLSGLEEALRRDLAAAMTEGIDRAVFTGDTGANENRADITGLTMTAITEETITQANKVKGPETLTAFLDMVDGVHAGSLGDLRVVATVGAYRLWESTVANAAAENQTIAGFLRQAGLSWMVRGEVETATGNGKFGAFVGRGRGIEGAGVAPVWSAAQLVRDPYSKAASGEVALTMHSLWGFALPRPANFQRVKFVT